MIQKQIELLAPAGSPDAYKAAAAAGADAVYLGAKGFNARYQARNFEDGDLETVIDDAHIRGMKVYFALNTLLGGNEIQEAAKLASFVYQQGIDGIIVQDLGLVPVLKEIAPQLSIHASTQITLHNTDGVKAARALGIDRVILSRELDLDEIKEIVQNTGIEVEVFVHGALCISRSGQCLLSSFIGGRSGNRGRCAQPCRLPWKVDGGIEAGEYLLSPKDLMTLEILPELLATGVSSLKIEGRMKSPEYVAAVVKVYRKYLDLALSDPAGYQVEMNDIHMLMQVFNRGGFTTGYMKGKSFQSLMSTEHPKHWGVLAGTVMYSDGKRQPQFTGREEDRMIPIKFQEKTSMGDGLEIWDLRSAQPQGPYETCQNKLSAILSVMMKTGSHVKEAVPGDTIMAGNFKSDAAPGSPVYKTYDKKLMETLSGMIQKNTPRVPITGEIRLFADENPVLIVSDRNGNTVSAQGEEAVQEAHQKPVSEERISGQLKKTGDTPYYFEEINVSTDDRSYIPVSAINTMRREALAELSEKRRNRFKKHDIREYHFNEKRSAQKVVSLAERGISLFFNTIPEEMSWEGLTAQRVYLPLTGMHPADRIRRQGMKVYVWLPAVLHDRQMEYAMKKLAAEKDEYDGILVGNLGALYRVREEFPDLPAALDFQMNLFNSWAVSTVNRFQPTSAMLSVELNMASIQAISSPWIPLEVYVYGDIPMMTMEYCPGSSQWSCNQKCGVCSHREGYLTDRMGKRFLYKTDPLLQRTTLYNSSMLMLDDTEPLRETDVKLLRVGIMRESPEETKAICRFYAKQWVEGLKTKDTRTELLQSLRAGSLTKGHFYRGAE